MPARSPATTQGGSKGPVPSPPRTSLKATSTGPEAQPPLLEGLPDGPQARHAALLDGSKLGRGVGDGQQVRLFQALQRTYGNAQAASIVAQLKAAQTEQRNGNGATAVELAVQRQSGAACPAPPAPP